MFQAPVKIMEDSCEDVFLLQTGVPEITWVVADHTAASGTRELSVTKGQAVEVLESEGVSPEWTLVRLVGGPGQSSGEAAPEGLVPTRALQQPPSASCKTSPSRKVQAGASMSQQLSVAVDDSGKSAVIIFDSISVLERKRRD